METKLMDDSFDLELENILSKDENYRYLPWIGINFKTATKKIMVVAESVYLWGDGTKEIAETASKRDFGRLILDQELEGSFKDKRMFENFIRAFKGINNVDINSKIEFWKEAVFHELVQVPMPNIDARPTKNDFIVGASYLGELAQLLMPNTIIVFGTDWHKKVVPIKKAFLDLDFKEVQLKHPIAKINGSHPRVLTLDKAGNEVKILFMKHPSERFSSNLWHTFILENI